MLALTGVINAWGNWRDFWPDDIIGIIRRIFTACFFKIDKNLSDNSVPIMSEDNAQNHANFADAFIMTARAIKIDKRLPCFTGGRVGNVKLDRPRNTSLAGLRALVRRVVWWTCPPCCLED